MKPTETPGQSKPQVRAKVLRAALEAIEELGPDRVRVKDVADRAGMSSGHVMYYFGDRDRILVDTLLLSESNLAERRTRALSRASDPWDAADRVSRLYLPSGPHDIRWTLWAQVVARPPTDAPTLARLRDAVDSYSEVLADVVRRGVVDGLFRDVDPEATAYRYCRFMDGLALEVLLGAPGRPRAWAVEEAGTTWRAFVG